MPQILTLNAGSSSVRFALFSSGTPAARLLDGKLERIGGEAGAAIADRVAHELTMKSRRAGPDAVGHRVVHGMLHTQPEPVSSALLTELRRIAAFDPEHLPREIELIEAMQRRYPDVPQVACFDTAFHRGMPRRSDAVADSAPLYGQRRAALRLSWAVLYFSHAGTWAPGRPCRLARSRDTGASRQRRQPRGRARWKLRRHQHGIHAGRGIW